MRKPWAKLVTAASAAAMAIGAAATPAAAYDSWCEAEPPVTVVTPAGEHVTVNNFIAVPRQYLHVLRGATADGWTEPAGSATLIHIHVHTPSGQASILRVTSRSDRFEVSKTEYGNWGTDLYLELTVPIQ